MEEKIEERANLNSLCHSNHYNVVMQLTRQDPGSPPSYESEIAYLSVDYRRLWRTKCLDMFVKGYIGENFRGRMFLTYKRRWVGPLVILSDILLKLCSLNPPQFGGSTRPLSKSINNQYKRTCASKIKYLAMRLPTIVGPVKTKNCQKEVEVVHYSIYFYSWY